MSQILDSITCPIDNNVSLIEASAGTGKTYNIQNLFVRMIMENGFSIESILVVTFTDAATRELKSRIRGILTDLSNYFTGRRVNEPERVIQLAEHSNISKNILFQRIEKALSNFDKASIFTIHSFCKKSLEENAFATGSFFNQQLQKNIEPILLQITQDFFRKYFYKTSEVEHYLNEYHKITINSCFKFLKNLQSKSNFIFSSDNSHFDFTRESTAIFTRLENTFDRERILGKLTRDIISQARDKYNAENLEKFLQNAEEFLSGQYSAETFQLLEKFTTGAIESSLKAKKELPQDDFFAAVDNFFTIVSDYKNAIYQKLYHFFCQEFQKEKLIDNFRTFDDLITVLDDSLRENQELVHQISKNYDAVLIDEFQDTDSSQYSIFAKLFLEESKPAFLIGDPKQAIYSFRGGDIYAYKTAKDYVLANGGYIYTLPTNYRSSENMVQAVNELFTKLPQKNKFLSDFIDFQSVDSREKLQDNLLYQKEPVTKSLRIFQDSDAQNTIQRDKFIFNQAISEIYKLLSDSDYQLFEKEKYRSVMPSDIAILVNTHAQAESLLPFLQKANIPAVIQATGSVYDSEEAQALNLVLKAIDEPGNLKCIRGALTTFLFDVTAEDLYQMHQEDSNEMEDWILFFRECQKRWSNGSFIEAFNYIVSKTALKQRLLSYENGDRKVTNLFHLQELIQQKEVDSSMGLSGLVNWFHSQLNPELREKENDIELRLETDEDALKIMTIHKSKGLEFPIVFCPFLWSKNTDVTKNLTIEYHNEQNQKVIDFEKNKAEKAEKEILEEDIRLVYVALTRSKYASYLFNVSVKKVNAIKYFLHQLNSENDTEILKSLKLKSGIKDFDAFANVELVNCENTELFSGKYQMQRNSGETELKKPLFTGNLSTQWQVNSFSSLVRSNVSGKLKEFKDYDEESQQPEFDDISELNIFTFPAGANVGSCWHEIFEEISFQAEIETIKEIAAEKLTKYGIGTPELNLKYAEITTEMVQAVLNCQLSHTGKIELRNITDRAKIHELEFFFSIKNNVSRNEINEILAAYNLAFEDSIATGFLTGFIDLVFQWNGKYYIADWKSNAIGGNQRDFSEENIELEMHSHHYKLQYLIYTVALYKYLNLRITDFDYDRDFGGVFYIFLRGVNPGLPGSGVFYDLPGKELIERLAKMLR